MNVMYMFRDDWKEYDASAEAENLEQLLAGMEPGDCMVIQRFSAVAGSAREFLNVLTELELRGIRLRSLQEKFDTDSDQGRYAAEILQHVAQLDLRQQPEKPQENSREENRAKGRRPIEVDEEAFDALLEQWKNGEITARQAMNALNLKPNTFYRRAKERMTEVKNGEAILNAAKQLGKEIIAGVASGTEELSQAAEKFASEHDVESITNSVTETLGKNITAAGNVLNRYIDSLSKNFQAAVEQLEKKKGAGAELTPEEVAQAAAQAAQATATEAAEEAPAAVAEEAAKVVPEEAAEEIKEAAGEIKEAAEEIKEAAGEEKEAPVDAAFTEAADNQA